jgi:hypothetical protein
MYRNIKNNIIPFLLILNIISSFFIFYISKDIVFPDQFDYLALAFGILDYGQYSSWTELEGSYPNTLRTPGYPLFLSALLSINSNLIFIKLIQFCLHVGSIFLALGVLRRLGGNEKTKVIFLSILLFLVQIPFYSAYISSETLTIFLILLSAFILTNTKHRTKKFFYSGIVFGLITLTRPAFLLLPFFIIFTIISRLRTNALRNTAAVLFGCFLCLLPYSIWNFANHSSFQPTSLEGSASIMHMGFWSQKLPEGYQSPFDNYQTTIIKDAFYPSVFTKEELSKNLKEYEEEWKSVNQGLPDLSSNTEIQKMLQTKEKFPTYSSDYILKREKLLRKETIENIKENPGYYVASRMYNFFRIFFTGINSASFSEEKSNFIKLRNAYAFGSTFIFILGGFLLITVFLIRNFNQINNNFLFLYSYIIYTAAIHTPFTVQARYSVPIHFIILVLLSLVLSRNGLKSVSLKSTLFTN